MLDEDCEFVSGKAPFEFEFKAENASRVNGGTCRLVIATIIGFF